MKNNSLKVPVNKINPTVILKVKYDIQKINKLLVTLFLCFSKLYKLSKDWIKFLFSIESKLSSYMSEHMFSIFLRKCF